LELPDADKLQETDNAIMETVKELAGTLGIARDPLRGIIWVAFMANALDWPAFSLHGELALRPELRGKLSPVEWRPLLASSLVFETRFRGRERLLRVYFLSSFAISIVSTILFFILITRYLLPSGPVYASTGRGLAGLLTLFFFAVFFLLIALPAPYFRRLRLKADQIAIEQFGTQSDLLTALKKIQGMSIRSGGRIGRLTTMEPTISRRLQNLTRWNR
jgi:hypothetical protein